MLSTVTVGTASSSGNPHGTERASDILVGFTLFIFFIFIYLKYFCAKTQESTLSPKLHLSISLGVLTPTHSRGFSSPLSVVFQAALIGVLTEQTHFHLVRSVLCALCFLLLCWCRSARPHPAAQWPALNTRVCQCVWHGSTRSRWWHLIGQIYLYHRYSAGCVEQPDHTLPHLRLSWTQTQTQTHTLHTNSPGTKNSSCWHRLVYNKPWHNHWFQNRQRLVPHWLLFHVTAVWETDFKGTGRPLGNNIRSSLSMAKTNVVHIWVFLLSWMWAIGQPDPCGPDLWGPDVSRCQCGPLKSLCVKQGNEFGPEVKFAQKDPVCYIKDVWWIMTVDETTSFGLLDKKI